MTDPKREDDATPLDELIGEYMTRVDRGEAVDRGAFIAEHPEFAEELRAHFANEDSVNALLTRRPAQVIRYFGDYELVEEIGRGGMGVVYRARQASLNRMVAVKLMASDRVSSPEAVRRFRQEAEAAANLRHDNIVAIHEVGEHDGQHYFSMDLIEGRSLAELVRESPLNSRQAARYVMAVAEAIDYAHQQGTLHRDLKPSNILIGPTGKPVVTDFGLAKRVEDDSGLTQSGDVVGTPSYMPPEQASGRNDELCPASDVYSLGATLYELVTGRPPFRAETPAATLLQVLNAEPVSPKLLNPALDRDLETICLKCLEKEPRRRLQTAGELADELGRFLDGRPIRSRPISRPAKLWRWCGRNPVVAGLGAAVAALVLLLAIAGPLVAWREAWLRREGEAQRQLALQREREAVQAHREAEARQVEIAAVLDFVEEKVFAAARPSGQDGGLGHDVTLRMAIESALPFVAESFPDQPLIEARLRVTLGTSFQCLGEAEKAEAQFQRAWEIYTTERGPDHFDTLHAMMCLGNSYCASGRYQEALKLNEDTLQRKKERLGLDHPDTLSSMNNLANTYAELGRREEAIRLFEKTLQLMKAKLGPDHPHTLGNMNNLAVNYARLGRYEEATKLLQETLRLAKERFGPGHPDTLIAMVSLAHCYHDLGRFEEALELNEEAVRLMTTRLGADHPKTLRATQGLAVSYSSSGREQRAVELLEETLPRMNSKLGPDHPDTLLTMGSLARSYQVLGRHQEALDFYEERARRTNETLGPDHPDTLHSMMTLGLIYSESHRHEEAVNILQETSRRTNEQLGPDHPDTLRARMSLAESCIAGGRNEEGVAIYQETLRRMREKFGPDQFDTIVSTWAVAETLVRLDRGAEAVPFIDECFKRAADNDLDSHLVAGAVFLRLEHFEKTEDPAGCQTTAEMWEKLGRTDADSLYYATCLRAVTSGVFTAVGETEEAHRQADQAIGWLKQALAAGYADFKTARRDPQLDSLRERDEFQRLLAELENRSKEKGK